MSSIRRIWRRPVQLPHILLFKAGTHHPLLDLPHKYCSHNLCHGTSHRHCSPRVSLPRIREACLGPDASIISVYVQRRRRSMSADIKLASSERRRGSVPPSGDGSDFWRCALFASKENFLSLALLPFCARAEIKDLSLRVLFSKQRNSGCGHKSGHCFGRLRDTWSQWADL